MSVGSGVKNEGEDIYGLAHYCEHMLFLGSKKYPSSTLFVDYITKNNGKFNGFTDFDTTGFFFKINKDNFPKALDIFSQFFIEPLFNATYVEKEVNSVNSEFERNIQLDKKRKEQVLRDNANPKSLFYRFSTGNNKTLLGFTKKHNISLRDRVIKYYKTHYTIDNMKLVIYGNSKISELKKLVAQTFGKAPKPKTAYKFVDNRPLPYEFFKQGKIIFYQTINDHQLLDISFMIPDIHKALPNNFSLYFRLLLNNKGKESISDILKVKGLLTNFKVSMRRTYDGFSMMKINGYLTEKGMKELPYVIQTIYQYIEHIKKLSLNQDYYNFYRKSYTQKFQFNHKKNKLMPFMKAMCVDFWKYPKKYLFSKHSLLPPYDEKKIKEFQKYIVINNSVILLGHKDFTEPLLSNYKSFIENFSTPKINFKQEIWYNTKYAPHKVSEAFMKNILNKPQTFKVEFLTEKVKPLPKHISLVKQCKKDAAKKDRDRKTCIENMKNDKVDLTPLLILKNEKVEFYHKLDRSFLISKTNLFVKFVFNKDVNNAKYATFLRLLVHSLNHHLRHYFSEEHMRHNNIHINASPK